MDFHSGQIGSDLDNNNNKKKFRDTRSEEGTSNKSCIRTHSTLDRDLPAEQ